MAAAFKEQVGCLSITSHPRIPSTTFLPARIDGRADHAANPIRILWCQWCNPQMRGRTCKTCTTSVDVFMHNIVNFALATYSIAPATCQQGRSKGLNICDVKRLPAPIKLRMMWGDRLDALWLDLAGRHHHFSMNTAIYAWRTSSPPLLARLSHL